MTAACRATGAGWPWAVTHPFMKVPFVLRRLRTKNTACRRIEGAWRIVRIVSEQTKQAMEDMGATRVDHWPVTESATVRAADSERVTATTISA